MTGKADSNDVRFWAKALDKKYPKTDLLSLSDDRLKQMLSSLKTPEYLPDFPDDKVYFYTLKSAWAVVQNGADDSGDVSDAYI